MSGVPRGKWYYKEIEIPDDDEKEVGCMCGDHKEGY